MIQTWFEPEITCTAKVGRIKLNTPEVIIEIIIMYYIHIEII